MLRARAFKTGSVPSQHIAATYFFNLTDELPVVSLITDPDSFFGATLGIYIYDNGAIGGRKDWERETHFEYFDTLHQLQFAQRFDSRLFGRTAIFYAQKSLSFDAYGYVHATFTKATNKDAAKYQPYLGWRPLEVVRQTLENTTQMARMH